MIQTTEKAFETWLERIPEFSLTDPASVTWAGGQVHGPRVCRVRGSPKAVLRAAEQQLEAPALPLPLRRPIEQSVIDAYSAVDMVGFSTREGGCPRQDSSTPQ